MSPMRSKTRNLLTLVVVVAGLVTPAARADVVDTYLVNHPQTGTARTTAEPPDLIERWVLAHTRRGAASRHAPDLVERWIAAHARS
jgi:hypothetical protein